VIHHNSLAQAAKNGLVYIVLIVARISTVHQDRRSLADQIAVCRNWCEDHLDQKFQVRVIQSQGSGERLDRKELNEIEEAIESRQLDLVIAEDLGRICRRNRAMDFLEQAEDHDTRVVMLNDNIDTVNDDWRLKANFATMHHELSNADTSKRIRRSLRNRFRQGMIKTVPFGYSKPFPKALDTDVTKDPEAEPTVLEVIARLEKGDSYSQVVDYLNEFRIPTGPFSSSKEWNVSLLSDLIHNPLLKGVREANRKKAKRNNKSGKRTSVKAPPEELLVREVPHLAYLDAEHYDRLVRMLDQKNAHFRRKKMNGRDSRAGVPKKRTRFPGQQVFCVICGHPFQWGGHGQSDHMVCKGAREYKCWQSATFDGHLAFTNIMMAVLAEISRLPNFTETLYAQVKEEFRSLTESRDLELKEVERRIAKLTTEMERLVEFVTNGKFSEFVANKIEETERRLNDAKFEIQDLKSLPSVAPTLPPSAAVSKLAKEAIEGHAGCPYELSRVMRTLVPRIEAHPMRLCDGGAIVIRAKFELNLTSLVPGLSDLLVAQSAMTRSVEVDLFEAVQREKFREQIVDLRKSGMFQREIAVEFGITQPAVQNALKLQAKMDELGLDSPYLSVTEPPEDLNKMRRHRHRRYKFRPLGVDESGSV